MEIQVVAIHHHIIPVTVDIPVIHPTMVTSRLRRQCPCMVIINRVHLFMGHLHLPCPIRITIIQLHLTAPIRCLVTPLVMVATAAIHRCRQPEDKCLLLRSINLGHNNMEVNKNSSLKAIRICVSNFFASFRIRKFSVSSTLSTGNAVFNGRWIVSKYSKSTSPIQLRRRHQSATYVLRK
jgi:hypothetical protein